MSLRRRVKRLEEASAGEARQIPFLFLGLPGRTRAEDEAEEAAWYAEYGDDIERESRRNPDRIFAVDFGCPDEEEGPNENP